jgi:hypothetical protein
MRQWGSSLNHNGMSFFPALVPAGTEFFHGTSRDQPVEGMEWLAFEPEHAQVFARRMARPPPTEEPRHPRPPSDSDDAPLGGVSLLLSEKGDQRPLEGNQDRDVRLAPDEKTAWGFLHTYLSKRDLQLLYIDGMSAGKTENGTLDSQDYILLNNSIPHSGGMWERERAQGMCNISLGEWGGRVDGFLRMEAGFEIILCHFERDLEVKSISRAGGECKNCKEDRDDVLLGFRYLRAVADRYHKIGGDRVKMNYEKMITAYTLDTDLFSFDERGPRLKGVSENNLRKLRKSLGDMVQSEPNPFKEATTNWQAIADMIVTRYSDRLRYLTIPSIFGNEQSLNLELDAILFPFINYDNRSFSDETNRCASHFITPKPNGMLTSIAADAVSYVNHYICYQLLSTQYGEASGNLAQKQSVITELMEKLGWTTWKECGTCAYDEICSIPIWPFGSEEDWIQPRCRNATQLGEQHGYWGEDRFRFKPPGNDTKQPPPPPHPTIYHR